MNIWCISKYASIPKYGAAARLFLLTREFVKSGENAILITSDANHLASFPKSDNIYNREVVDGVTVEWIKTKKYKKTASLSRVLSWIDFELKLFRMPKAKLPNPDVVIVSSLSLFTIIYGYYLKRKYSAFLVFEVRDIWPLTMTEEGGFGKWHPLVILMGWIEKFGYKKADLIVGTMPRLDMHINKLIGQKRPFFCSPLGFDENLYGQLERSDKFDTLFPKDKIIIGYAGSMGVTNALETFIEAIYKIDKESSNLYFVLVGDGDLKEAFKERLRGCNNVMFLPKIRQEDVKYFLQKCNIVYLSAKPSKVWRYGQSMNKIVEYMLAAKPIIASYSGCPSMINEAECGIIIPEQNVDMLKKEILNIANLDKNELSAMGQRGREWIQKHRKYDKLAKQYLDTVKQYMKAKEC